MEKLRRVAFFSIGRAVAFAGLAIVTVMVGLSFEPVLAFRTGGVLALLLLTALLLKAFRPFRDHRRTEAWLLLEERDRPDARYAGFVMVTAVREACFWFARWTAGVAAVIWAAALVLAWAGPGFDVPA
jgi:hypothetical protein